MAPTGMRSSRLPAGPGRSSGATTHCTTTSRCFRSFATSAEEMKKALVRGRRQKTSGTRVPAKMTVSRQQFEEMTAELLEETIRITRRTLDEAEQRYPGIREQISELLLVGGSARMSRSPSGSQGVRLGAPAHRPGPGGRQGRGTVRRGTDRPVHRAARPRRPGSRTSRAGTSATRAR